jgi:hypothetical protein
MKGSIDRSNIVSVSVYKSSLCVVRHQVAWSVAKVKNSCGVFFSITYQRVLINDCGAWRDDTNQAIIPHTGLYYLHLIVYAQANASMQVLVTTNNATTLFTVNYLFTNNFSVHARSMGEVVRLDQGDCVAVAIPPGGYCPYRSHFYGLLVSVV